MRAQRRWPKVALALGIVLVLAADVAVVLFRDQATPVTYTTALDRFRDEVGGTTSTTVPSLGPGGASTTEATDGTTTSEPVTTTEGPAAPVAVPPSTAPADARPAAGVYRYRTVGGEEVPFINAKRSYTPETFVTVTHGEGCAWHYRADFLAEHKDEYDFCTRDGILDGRSATISIRWFGISQAISLTCEPPIALLAPGAGPGVRTTRCEGERGLVVEMRVTPRGDDAVAIAGAGVPAKRVDWVMQFSGAYEGACTYTVWFEPTTGMILRSVREVDAQGESPLGRQRYVEHHTTTLTSLTPAT